MEHKRYVQILSVSAFAIGLILVFIVNPILELTIQNFLMVLGFISAGIGFGIVLGSPNFKKQQVISKGEIPK